MTALVAVEVARGKDASLLDMRAAAFIVAAMHPREKARLYHELAQLIRSGITFPKAICTLLPHTRGHAQAALEGVKRALDGGGTVAEALAAGAPFIAPLDRSFRVRARVSMP